MQDGRLRSRYDGALVATVGGILDRVRARGADLALDERDRLPGSTCLVTGANRGLGLAVSEELARRGGDLVLACRSGLHGAIGRVNEAAAYQGFARGLDLDLSKLSSVEAAIERLVADDARIDVLVLNAGVVPREARRTKDGLDEGFQVNFLANVLFVRRLLERGLLSIEGGSMPRIVVVSSESHRTAPAIDWAAFGTFRPWTVREAVSQYGYGKLLLQTFTEELGRRLHGRAAVHSLCPGAVRTDIGREAPPWVKPVLSLTMRAFFVEPQKAARPVVHLAASRAIEGETGIYLHAKTQKAPRDDTRALSQGLRIWEESERILAGLGHAMTRMNA